MNVMDLFRLDGKKALVTGGGSGIGRACCHALAEAGAAVAVVDISRDAAGGVAEELTASGLQARAVVADTSSEEEIKAMVRTVLSRWGRLDIAVNNAGISHRDDAVNVPIATWDRVMNLNLRGSFLCAQAEARAMIEQGGGAIIFTGSISAQIVNTPQMHVAYGASKAAVEHLVKALAYEWIRHGIRVNGISPGAVITPLVEKRLADLIPVWEKLYPIGRLGRPEEVKGAVVYLASEAASFMVGHNLVIDGGYTII